MRKESVGFLGPRQPISMQYLSPTHLKGLEAHKYASSGTTMLDPIIQKFWNKIVTWIPLWVAPNLITITGLLVNLFSSILLFYYFPTATDQNVNEIQNSVPSNFNLNFLFFLNAITVFIYQTLDAIDGKQARRTNTSSPLGELFDHGMDSISCVLICVCNLIALNSGKEPVLCLIFFILTNTTFYIAHWSTYLVGKLQFGYFDVTEAQWLAILMFTGNFLLNGSYFWDYLIFGVFPLRFIVYVSTLLFTCRIIKEHIERLILGGAGPNGSTISGTSVLSPLQPLLILYFLVMTIYQQNPAFFAENPVLVLLFFGCNFSKMSNNIIIAHMCKTELPAFDSCFYGLMVFSLKLVLNPYFPVISSSGSILSDYNCLILCLIYSIGNLLTYMYHIYNEIANYFKIDIFRIPYVKEGDKEGEPVAARLRKRKSVTDPK